MKKKEIQLTIYQTQSGALELHSDYNNETVWANLLQLSSLFERDKSVISRHINNIFKEGELIKNSVVAKNAITASDGKVYQVTFYNLDMILSVGYRVNSKVATQFRQWATKTLKEHITEGFTINPKRIQQNESLFIKAIGIVLLLLKIE